MKLAIALLCGAVALFAQAADHVLVVVNRESAVSRTIGEYYVLKRHIPLSNVCSISVASEETVSRAIYGQSIAAPIAKCLLSRHLTEKVLYIVTTLGVPLRVAGTATGPAADGAAVDSELTLLYGEIKGKKYGLKGIVGNPFFGQTGTSFSHPFYPIYLVTRLAGFDFADVKGIVDRALLAKNEGKFVLDLKSADNGDGNNWLRKAAQQLPRDRVILEESDKVLLNQTGVIGYASWGSNDPNRKQRHLGFHWLPGAIMTEFVSTNARTFTTPPEQWNLGNWVDQHTWFAGSPQSMTADSIHDGVTGASGHVDEPYLGLTPRPDLLLPAYYQGRNLAESYYLAIPGLSWMNIVVGDPLCALGKPRSGNR
jgi:uncharacterized protein (TIGR03790 family)